MPGAEGLPAAAFVVVDWGTTHLRLTLVRGADGGTEGTVASPRGIASLAAGEHREVFLGALAELLERCGASAAAGASASSRPLEVYFSGMATSNLGWCATPYVSTPAGPQDLWRHARVEDLRAPATASLPPRRLRLFFFPGLRTAVDVMRGEEVEALGVLEALEGASAGSERRLVVLPGTHSKWILCAGGRLLDFVTVPTGDLFAALHRETLLARTLPDGPAAVEGPLRERFDAGLRAAREAGPLSTLFHVRSRAVLEDHGWTPAECSAFLSGVLIGGEVIERWARRGDARVVLAGAEPLRRLYSRAFSVLAEDQVEALDRDLAGTVVVLGIRRLRRARPPGGAQSGTGL